MRNILLLLILITGLFVHDAGATLWFHAKMLPPAESGPGSAVQEGRDLQRVFEICSERFAVPVGQLRAAYAAGHLRIEMIAEKTYRVTYGGGLLDIVIEEG